MMYTVLCSCMGTIHHMNAGRILTRVQSLETSALQQSTFTIDCTQVVSMFNQATRKALILVSTLADKTLQFPYQSSSTTTTTK